MICKALRSLQAPDSVSITGAAREVVAALALILAWKVSRLSSLADMERTK